MAVRFCVSESHVESLRRLGRLDVEFCGVCRERRRPPPSAAEAERIASDMAVNDGLLQKGDIVVTDRGFFLFRGPSPDGVTNEFTRVPDPALPANQPGNLTKQRSDGRRPN